MIIIDSKFKFFVILIQFNNIYEREKIFHNFEQNLSFTVVITNLRNERIFWNFSITAKTVGKLKNLHCLDIELEY